MPDRAQLAQAWAALKYSRTEITLRSTTGQHSGPANLLQLVEREARRKRANLTGYVPKLGVSKLTEHGIGQSVAGQAVRKAIRDRFPAFANSWDGYIDNNGWLLDLLLLPEAERNRLTGDDSPGRLLELVERAAGSPMSLVADTSMATELAELSELNARRDETHPAFALMVRVHGLHPELARAVMLHARVVPWWAYALLVFFILLGGGTFLLALVAPHSPVFDNESVGGVGLGHYVLLPLVVIGFSAALWWLARSRPRFEAAWREQLERYERATAGNDH